MQISTYFDSGMQMQKSPDFLTTTRETEAGILLFKQLEDHKWLWKNIEEL